MKRIGLIGLLCAVAVMTRLASCAATDFKKVAALFTEHCLDCHSSTDPDGKLVLETHAELMRGGESGLVVDAGKPDESLLVKMIEGNYEKEGKKIVMPPGKRKKLSAAEIAEIRSWVSEGAMAGEVEVAREIVAPKITPSVTPKASINALAYHEAGKLLAVARVGAAEIWSAEEQRMIQRLSDSGIWNSVVFSKDGKFVFVGGGESGILGEVRQYEVGSGELVRSYGGHRDAVYAVAISPDGKVLATGSYDQKIKLWNVETGAEIRTLSGHNGCVYGLDFRADGKILASASGDRTVKLWDVSSGERRDTLSQSLKELYTVAFTPDGKRVAAAGVDNRIRVWEVSEEAKETTNPLLHSKFAHEGPILRIVYSADGQLLASVAEDRSVKIWEAGEIKEKLLLEKQSDWAPAVAFVLGNKGVAVGRSDASLDFYDAANGSKLLPPKPELARIQPRGVQQGKEAEVKLHGKFLAGVKEVLASNKSIRTEMIQEGKGPGELRLKLWASKEVPRGVYTLRVKSDSGESGDIQFHVDDLAQFAVSESKVMVELPATVWGEFRKAGQVHQIDFDARKGEQLVFDAGAKSIGSKTAVVLTLKNAKGQVLASSNGVEWGGDALIAYTVTEDGRYELEINEQLLGASGEHFFRVSCGQLPLVTGVHPIAIPAEQESELELVGYNIAEKKVRLTAGKVGEMVVPLDAAKNRARTALKVAVAANALREQGENDKKEGAQTLALPGKVAGRSEKQGDEDWFKIEANKGQVWIMETRAARAGSPMDTRIEVLDEAGKQIDRVILQAVRDSAVTFRGIDSVTVDCRVENWEEMELNQYLYMQGEVVRLFRMPQGPDSGFNFYLLNGKRRNYFDTTATAHANEEACYIVEPRLPGEKLVQTGLPVFPIYFENDDDADRKLGSDSRLNFTAPKDGTYYVRVMDSRKFGGDRFVYELSLREAAPSFNISINGMNPTVAAGSGQSFSVVAERLDGFEGEIDVEISGAPEGITISSPLVIQAGHTTAFGTINASPDAKSVSDKVTTKLVATAKIHDQTVVKEAGSLGTIRLAEKAPVYVAMEGTQGNVHEITITPGGIVPAMLKVKRAGHDDLLTFAVDNLPHGIIVDNIGLSGVLIPKEENGREIFLTAQKWVPETDRLCYAICNEAGRQTSVPVLIKVRKAGVQQVAGK